MTPQQREAALRLATKFARYADIARRHPPDGAIVAPVGEAEEAAALLRRELAAEPVQKPQRQPLTRYGCAVMLDPRNKLVDPDADTIERYVPPPEPTK